MIVTYFLATFAIPFCFSKMLFITETADMDNFSQGYWYAFSPRRSAYHYPLCLQATQSMLDMLSLVRHLMTLTQTQTRDDAT